EPRELVHAARDARLVAQGTQDVIAREQEEEVREAEKDRLHLAWLGVDGAAQAARPRRPNDSRRFALEHARRSPRCDAARRPSRTARARVSTENRRRNSRKH